MSKQAKKTDFLEVLKDQAPGVLSTTAGIAAGYYGLKMIRNKMNLQGLGTIGDVIGAVTTNAYGQYVPNAVMVIGGIIGSQSTKNPHLQAALIGVAISGFLDAANRFSGKQILAGLGAVDEDEMGYIEDEEFGYIEDEFGAIKKVRKVKKGITRKAIAKSRPAARPVNRPTQPKFYDLAGAEYVEDDVMQGLEGDDNYISEQMDERFTRGFEDDFETVDGLEGPVVELA